MQWAILSLCPSNALSKRDSDKDMAQGHDMKICKPMIVFALRDKKQEQENIETEQRMVSLQDLREINAK